MPAELGQTIGKMHWMAKKDRRTYQVEEIAYAKPQGQK